MHDRLIASDKTIVCKIWIKSISHTIIELEKVTQKSTVKKDQYSCAHLVT